ncbi:UNVERIFIED_CONTAM: Retrovirus-related Pol polyprotein from transposon TNT 1-94 [Sesamum angustifolium]|uniref:Retrovirus-related Pol polyprotein from transposon TNT 1-94 n=1 Tax=Sesamum angustifolium TaxID=2727405 RepID=A0AAW2L061_9LAMI
MSNYVQKQYDRLDDVASILQRMKEVHEIPDRHTEGSSVQEHGVKMLSLVEKLEDLKKLGLRMTREASTSKVKGKRAECWKRKKGKAKAEIVIIAKDAKSALNAPVGMGKGKRRMGTQQQSRANDICAYCCEKGHWKRDCPNLSSNQGMFIVEVNMVTISASWVLDTYCGAHICNDLQVLQRNRKLSKDEVVLRLGDGKAVAAAADEEVVGLKESRNKQFRQLTSLCLWTTEYSGQRGFSYFITFTDAHSWYGYVYLMRYKSEAFVRFKEFRLEVENQTGRKIKTLQSDRGGEYLSGEFVDYLKENGVVSQ